MAFRRVFYRWLWLAALVLPFWLLLGWGVFGASGWAFLWVIFIAVPSVLLGELALALLTRSRPSVARERAASWWDVLGFSVWHLLTIAVGLFDQRWFSAALAAAIIVGIGMFWLQFWQLRREAGSFRFRRSGGDDDGPDVVVIEERRPDS